MKAPSEQNRQIIARNMMLKSTFSGLQDVSDNTGLSWTEVFPYNDSFAERSFSNIMRLC